MVTRRRGVFVVTTVALALAVLTSACERVPLLAPTGSTITLTTATSALGFNGKADIIAQVIEPAGTPPHSGTHITFTTTLGTIEPAEVLTDLNGRATAKFVAGTSSGIATISAISGGASVAAAGTLKIAVGSAAVAAVVASANPATVSSQGGNSTISAKVTDGGGNALAGIPVTMTTDAGSINPSVATTDSTGTATAVLTTNRTAKVTATAGVATSTTGADGKVTTTTPATSSVTVTVNATQGITIGTPAPASPNVGQTVSFPLTYQATGTSGASPIVRVNVDWGDGRSSQFTGQPSAVSHAYSSPGSYLVVVTGFDALGDTSTASAAVTVTPRGLPTVAIDASSTRTTGTPITFTITATPTAGNSITSVSIDFGDGQSTTLAGNVRTAQHVYNTAGTYTVTATARDTSGESGSATTVIVVTSAQSCNAPVASFSFTNSSRTFTFDGSGSTGCLTFYQWEFGDNSSDNGAIVTHTYGTSGGFTVKLTVTDNIGRVNSTTRSVTVP